MRLCRFEWKNEVSAGFYFDDRIAPLKSVLAAYSKNGGESVPPTTCEIVSLLRDDKHGDAMHGIASWLDAHSDIRDEISIETCEVTLKAPIPNPSKIVLLAGNYAAHIEEEGLIALERAETYPYLFMKPPSTVNHPNAAIPIPSVSLDHIDYECELGVVIGKTARRVSEANALEHIAGYTVVNDISDRQYKPFPNRKPRERDFFFDWLHGKWHDGFFPMGPCIASSRTIPDPQRLGILLSVDGEVRQSGSTAQMIFPVAALIEFITRTITLRPGDIIATGTPAGVGMASGRFLKSGDVIDATIEGIGTLHNVMAMESD